MLKVPTVGERDLLVTSVLIAINIALQSPPITAVSSIFNTNEPPREIINQLHKILILPPSTSSHY